MRTVDPGRKGEKKVYIIDRYEGEYAILEDEEKRMVKVRKTELPKHVKEGDCLTKKEHGYELDETATMERRAHIQSMMNDLFE